MSLYRFYLILRLFNAGIQTPAAEEAELETPQRGLSTVSLPVNFHIQQPSFPPIQQSADDYSGSLASVQSELNEHIIRGKQRRFLFVYPGF